MEEKSTSASMDALRTETVLGYLEGAKGARCTACGGAVCGHVAVMCLAMGFKHSPRCFACLAADLGRGPEELRDHLYAYIIHHDCYRAGWERASHQEGFEPEAAPACLWPAAGYGALGDLPENGTMAATQRTDYDAEWDAGDTACGDLVLELRLRLQALKPGAVLKVTARDLGAPADLPAYCRLTKHILVRAEHPDYWIRRREE